jgi:hypothetical protein
LKKLAVNSVFKQQLRRLFPWLLCRTVYRLAIGIALFSNSGVPLCAQYDEGQEVNREYAIKAAYLYQFARYVEWPPNAFTSDTSPLIIGVLGTDPFGGILDEIARSKRIDGHPIIVHRFSSMADYKPCHILFIGASVSQAEKAAAIEKARGSSVLLVGEEPGFADEGGMINFFMDENKIRFEINAENAKQDRLKISSKLLSLAKIVGVKRY